MATVSEKFRGISGDQNSRQILYLVEDAVDDNDALDALENPATGSPYLYDNMPRENIRIEELSKKDGLYEGVAVYKRAKNDALNETEEKPDTGGPGGLGTPAANESTYRFEQVLESVRIRESTFAATRYTAAGNGVPPTPNKTDAIKFSGINALPSGDYEGTDIRRPIGSFTLDWFPQRDDWPGAGTSVINSQYQKNVRLAVGKINSLSFYGHAAGEVLLVGASGQVRNSRDWQFTFRFEVRENVSDSIGSGSNEIAYEANGWDYVWVYYNTVTETLDDGTKKFIKQPRQVNVEQIYQPVDFNTILFPTTAPTS